MWLSVELNETGLLVEVCSVVELENCWFCVAVAEEVISLLIGELWAGVDVIGRAVVVKVDKSVKGEDDIF